MDWAGYNTIQKMRSADTEVIHSVATIYSNATGNQGSITGQPIVDGYVSLESFDQAALDGTLADVPYMIGYTLNDMGNMSAGIAEFCKNREEKGCWRPWTKGDWDLSEKMLTAWTNFCKYGDPNGPDGGEWAPCTKDNPNFMVFKLDENDVENSEFTQPITKLPWE